VTEHDPEVSLSDCTPAVTDEPTLATTACELVSTPELSAECRFLEPAAPVPEPGSGGAGGTPAQGDSGAPAEDAGGTAGSVDEAPAEAGAANEPVAGAGGVPTE
jgi:hypothetical protein